MPIKVKTDLEYGDQYYVRTDCEQLPHSLVGLELRPAADPAKNVVKFILDCYGEEVRVFDFDCKSERWFEPDRNDE